MTSSLWCAWVGGVQIASARLPAEGLAVLALLAASLLVFRTFRERYFLAWILGWLAYVIYRMPGIAALPGVPVLPWVPLAAFILAAFLFSAAVLFYTESGRLMLPCALVAGADLITVVMRSVFWPASRFLLWAIALSFRTVVVVAVVQLLRYAWGKWQIGPWLLAMMLLLLHAEPGLMSGHGAQGADLIIDILLGLSMLMIVFDESQMRTRRLRVVNAVATAMAQATDSGSMLEVALQQLKQLTGARAAWFRMMEGKRNVIVRFAGLSRGFLKDRQNWALDNALARAVGNDGPTVVRDSKAEPVTREQMQLEGFRQVLVIPVRGKNSMLGTLALASARRRSCTTEELTFLATEANQLGMAVENLRFFEQIRRSQREWVSTFDSIEDYILVHDSEHRIIKANRALLTRLDREPAEVIGRECVSVLPRVFEEWEGCPYCAPGTTSFAEAPDPCFGGTSLVSTSSYMWSPSYTEEDTRELGTVHIVRDTTDRHAAEEKYRLLFEQVHEGVFVAERGGRLLDCNNGLVTMLGYNAREELLAQNADALYAVPEQRHALLQEIESKGYVRSFEVQLRKRDGAVATALETSFASRKADGEIERYQGFLLDVTEKKRAEDEMERRNRELHALNAIAAIATQSFDLDEIVNLTLRQVVQLFGAENGAVYLSDDGSPTLRRRASWGPSDPALRHTTVAIPAEFWDYIGSSRVEMFTHRDVTQLPPNIAEIVRNEGLRYFMWVVLWSKEKPAGALTVSRRYQHEFGDSDEKMIVAIGRQLSATVDKIRLYDETSRAYEDLRHTQEQLLQSEKMSAVGQLISGVAHELNNPLTAILGYAQLLESLELDEHAHDFVRKLFKQAQRTHRLVQNLLSFARQHKPQRMQVDVRRVLEETLSLREYDLKHNNIAVEREIAAELPAVAADPHQLEQVFLNIINNAVDAMLETERAGTLRVRVNEEQDKVCVEFVDSGPGIGDPKRIFDPFYTTKGVGKGTGLGLSICYGIVKEHGGEIMAQNNAEGGARVIVSLPSAGKVPTFEKPVAPVRKQAVLQGRVLLVDDEEGVLEFQREVLAGAGAQVVTASRPEAALASLRGETFDAVILNGSMPNGWSVNKLCKWLAENTPGLEKRVLLTFAHLVDNEMQEFLRQNRIPYLIKPFELADLISATGRILQRAQAASAN